MPKFGHGFHEFFFKVQHREEEYCDDYFIRLGNRRSGTLNCKIR